METKWTPGPWISHIETVYEKEGQRRLICLIEPMDDKERRANAALIGAAPEMYELLEKAEAAFWILATSGNKDAILTHRKIQRVLREATSR